MERIEPGTGSMTQHYDDLSYSTITDARYDDGRLLVWFEDGSCATLTAADVIPNRVHAVNLNGLPYEKHMVIAPTDGESLAIPWDVIRVLTDPAFDAHLGAVEERLRSRRPRAGRQHTSRARA
jgi:hypothetical protein